MLYYSIFCKICLPKLNNINKDVELQVLANIRLNP